MTKDATTRKYRFSNTTCTYLFTAVRDGAVVGLVITIGYSLSCKRTKRIIYWGNPVLRALSLNLYGTNGGGYRAEPRKCDHDSACCSIAM